MNELDQNGLINQSIIDKRTIGCFTLLLLYKKLWFSFYIFEMKMKLGHLAKEQYRKKLILTLLLHHQSMEKAQEVIMTF